MERVDGRLTPRRLLHVAADRMGEGPVLLLEGPRSVGKSPYALAGVPDHATIALGLHGCTRDPQNRPHVREEVRIVCEELQPARIVVYGSTAYRVLDYPRELGIPVQVFTPDTYQRSHSRRAAA